MISCGLLSSGHERVCMGCVQVCMDVHGCARVCAVQVCMDVSGCAWLCARVCMAVSAGACGYVLNEFSEYLLET